MGHMDTMFGFLQKTSKWLSVIAGTALTLMMLLTVADVIMRAWGHPIMGTYELVGLSLAMVIGFGIPKVSLKRQHIYMDFLVDRLSRRNKAIMNTFTRILCIILFVLIGYSLFSIGNEFRMSGEVSPTIKLPFYPMAYGVGICCFIECFVFIFEIVKGWRAIDE
jgi:TRAP-type C4-dicarboxylate transport system permease small subunit